MRIEELLEQPEPNRDPPAAVTDPSVGERQISKGILGCLGLVLVLSYAVVYGGREIVSGVANLYSQALPANPYFVPAHAGLLYVSIPVIVMSSLTLLLLPGMFLVLASGRSSDWADLVIGTFGVSFIGYVFLTSAVKLASRVPPDSATFIAAIGGGGALGWTILALRVFRGSKLPWPISQNGAVRRLCWSIAIPVMVLLSLLPVIFWQDLNDDGIEALDIGRSLSTYLLPRFPNASGFMGLGLGMMPMAYPVHWFVTLFGPIEASARLPLLLYLPVLFCLLIRVIEWRSPRRLEFAEEGVLCLSLGIYTVTMGYNASYDPYFADLASPTALETMTIVCMLGMIYFLLRGQNGWFLFFALVSYLSRPTGLLVLGLLGWAIALCLPQERGPLLKKISVAMALCVLVAIFFETIFLPSVVGATGFGYPSRSILGRVHYLRLDDLSRIGYGLFPSGILPFISLVAFRWQDSLGRIIAIVSLSYFAFFYFPAFIALHHFVPIMVLPLVVFWRIYLHREMWFRRLTLPAAALAGIAAFWVSLPRHFEINRTVRAIGQKTTFLVGDYHTDYRTQVRRASLLFEFIPPDWEVEDPRSELVSGPNSIIYYSVQPKPPGASINYLVQPVKEAPPAGFSEIATDAVAALYINDLQEWRRDRFRSLNTDYRSRLYSIPRGTLFRHWGVPQEEYSIDLKSLIDYVYTSLFAVTPRSADLAAPRIRQ